MLHLHRLVAARPHGYAARYTLHSPGMIGVGRAPVKSDALRLPRPDRRLTLRSRPRRGATPTPVPGDDTMLKENDIAPDFTLPADDGSEVRLSDLRGRKVVLYFYPKDDTPGCTTQACDIRDNFGE